MRRLVLIGLAVVVLAVGIGIGVAVSRDTAPAGSELRLRATAEQWRTHEVARTLAVALHNDGSTPVRVSRVEPVLPAFDGEGAVAPDAVLPPGGLRVDIPVPYGTGSCRAAPAASHVVVDARPDGSRTWQRLTLALPYPNPLLDRLLAADCAAERVRRSVSLGFGPWRADPAGGLRGTLIAERAAAGPETVTVHQIDGNVVYRVTARGGTPLAVLTAADARVEVALAVDAFRCDLHAIAEVKKPYEFPVRVSVGGGAPLASTVPVTDRDRQALDAMLRQRCNLPS